MYLLGPFFRLPPWVCSACWASWTLFVLRMRADLSSVSSLVLSATYVPAPVGLAPWSQGLWESLLQAQDSAGARASVHAYEKGVRAAPHPRREVCKDGHRGACGWDSAAEWVQSFS